jgi:hypothetical protein
MPDAWRNQQTLTDYGFVVVGGAGYPGTGPTGQAGPNWIYATSMVNYRLGPIEINFGNTDSYIDRSQQQHDFPSAAGRGHRLRWSCLRLPSRSLIKENR